MAALVTSDGVELFYAQHGRGPRVFALAGGPANDHRYLADDLAPIADDYEFVYHDYRGSGQSASAPLDTYTFARLAADLDELRSRFGDDKIVVLGHSMGGFVALTYALLYPEHCERLILVGAFPSAVPRKLLPPTFRALGWARTTKMVSRALWWLVAFSWKPRTDDRRRRLYAVWSTLQEGRPAVRAREIDRERRLGLPLANDNIPALQREFIALDLSDRLPLIACPVLVLYGDRDAAAVWGGSVFRQQLRDVECCVLDDIGHDPLFEAPGASGDAIQAFFRSRSNRAS